MKNCSAILRYIKLYPFVHNFTNASCAFCVKDIVIYSEIITWFSVNRTTTARREVPHWFVSTLIIITRPASQSYASHTREERSDFVFVAACVFVLCEKTVLFERNS